MATRHHAVITKVFQKSFQAECDDGSVWKQVLIELMRGPNCLNGVWQHMQNVDTDSDPDELPAAVEPESVEPESVEPESVEPAAVEPAAVSSDSDSDSSSSEEEEEIVEVVVVGRKKKRRFR